MFARAEPVVKEYLEVAGRRKRWHLPQPDSRQVTSCFLTIQVRTLAVLSPPRPHTSLSKPSSPQPRLKVTALTHRLIRQPVHEAYGFRDEFRD